VWVKAREGRKKMSKKWLRKLKSAYPFLAEKAIAMNERDGFLMPGEEKKEGKEEKGKEAKKGKVEEIGGVREVMERQEDRENRNGNARSSEKEVETQVETSSRSGSTDGRTNAQTVCVLTGHMIRKRRKQKSQKRK
jgi:hypothetical protein